MLSLLQEELKAAMKAKDKATLSGLRNIIGKLKVRRIDKGEDLTKEECIQIKPLPQFLPFQFYYPK